jgi:hypothetical protein
MKSTPERLSANQLSTLSGFDRRTIKSIMQDRPGPYSLREFCEGVRRHYTGRVIDQRERRARVSADLLELELRERVGELMPTPLCTYFMENMAVMIRTRLMGLAGYVAAHRRGADLSDIELGKVIDEQVRNILHDAANGEAFFDAKTSKGGTIALDDFSTFMEKLLSENEGAAKWNEIYARAKPNDDSTATEEGASETPETDSGEQTPAPECPGTGTTPGN